MCCSSRYPVQRVLGHGLSGYDRKEPCDDLDTASEEGRTAHAWRMPAPRSAARRSLTSSRTSMCALPLPISGSSLFWILQDTVSLRFPSKSIRTRYNCLCQMCMLKDFGRQFIVCIKGF